MQRLDFSYNWNGKLDNDYFTSLRLSGRFEVGEQIEVWEKKHFRGIAEIVGKNKLPNIDHLNEYSASLDTGYPLAKTKEIIQSMYIDVLDWRRQPIYFYLIKYTTKIKPETSPNIQLKLF